MWRLLSFLPGIVFIAGPLVAAPVEFGASVPELVFKDIHYLPRTLDDLREQRAYVLAFAALSDAQAGDTLKALDALQATCREQAVVASVNVNSSDTIMETSEQAIRLEVGITLLKDMSGAATSALGVTCTPTVVVLDAERRLQFRGDLEGARQALEAVLAGTPVTAHETPVNGAPIHLREVPEPARPVTFAEHIAPIVYKNCAECHRPGASAPFSLLTYGQVSSRADMIQEVVLEERMPPWYGSRAHSGWTNERQLTQEQQDLIAQWVRGGKQEGNLNFAPPKPEFPKTEWRIPEPDLVLTAPKPFDLPATGYIPYEYVQLPYQFPADTYVQGIDIRPKNPDVVHHANLVFVLPNQQYDGDHNFLTGYVPGGRPADVPSPVAMMIPKDAVLVLQIHYVTTGKLESDQMQVGIRYARGTVAKRVHYRIVRPKNEDLVIPAGDPFFRISAERTIDTDAVALALFSHMHLRGRDMTFVAEYPDGRQETLLVVPNYSFDWQIAYLYPPVAKIFPKGTKIRTISHYDNSTFNPYNPDPGSEVVYGPQTMHEMNDAYVFYLDRDENLNLQIDPRTGQALQAVAQSN
ncbi:MAG: alkyl hydroperoxide reductase [Candidatus Hydrogenedentes bacterium]|nr:alkyl hydroperoxide reductase [Candidatus Hydrogenedentota bacterium]